ncbi:hypothetical protein [Hyalangium sp.]|uniref:hypothetical protein n=1 Tax=Hyalangium sp. TaxID=2028555 RepID=UPI002D4F3DCB|nr:hypothetical protein [Hyalangium sp.]HYH95807.1 hypothetical protein [Hyalangium sp.]
MRCWLAVGGIALLVLGAGCATSQNERRMLLERTSAEIAYDLPAEQVMAAARAVLDGHGYLLAPGGGPHTLRTHWKIDGDLSSTARWSKVLVIGQHRKDGRFIVRAQQVTWATGGRTASHPGMASSVSGAGKRGSEGTSNYIPGEPYSPAKPVFSRALGLEWAVLQHLDPQFAAEVEQQVDLYLASPKP